MKKVLIVDDSSMMRRLIRNVVVKNGFTVVGEASTGKAGVRKYKELRPDIVTLDMVMDEMTGIEALSRILGENPDANVIMISSMGQDVLVRDAIVLGARDFILKPFDEEEVMSAIGKCKFD